MKILDVKEDDWVDPNKELPEIDQKTIVALDNGDVHFSTYREVREHGKKKRFFSIESLSHNPFFENVIKWLPFPKHPNS